MELNTRLTLLVVETARLERRGVNDNVVSAIYQTLLPIKYQYCHVIVVIKVLMIRCLSGIIMILTLAMFRKHIMLNHGYLKEVDSSGCIN